VVIGSIVGNVLGILIAELVLYVARRGE
jgi:hypothetical protein